MEKPKCVRADLWEKFKKLEKRTDELIEKNKNKQENYKKKKKNKIEIKANSEENLVNQNKEETKEDLKIPSFCSNEENDSHEKEWQDLKQYLNINDHLQGSVAASSTAPKSGLEKKINDAISSGNIETAVMLSDRLATREFGTKIVESFDAREYIKRKKEEEMSLKAKKKKKLHWGFEHKQRWEMKGNM